MKKLFILSAINALALFTVVGLSEKPVLNQAVVTDKQPNYPTNLLWMNFTHSDLAKLGEFEQHPRFNLSTGGMVYELTMESLSQGVDNYTDNRTHLPLPRPAIQQYRTARVHQRNVREDNTYTVGKTIW